MPFSVTRDLWLVLKARDEAQGAMRAFSRDIRMVGDSVAEANLRASRSAIQNEMATRRLASAVQIAALRQGQQTAQTHGAIQAIENETRSFLLASQERINGIDKEIRSMHTERSVMEENRVTAQRLASVYTGLAQTTAALGTISLAASVIGAAGLKSLVDVAVEYQKQSSLTRTQVDKFASSLEDIEAIGLRIADSIGVPFEEIQPALFDIFSSMEVGAKDAERLLGIFSKAAVAGQTNIKNASTATIGILNAFQLPLSAINHLMDVQFQLVKEGIGSYDEWSQRIGLVTPSAVRFGQSVDMMAAALAASTRMGISAARSATAVSRAMDAMSNPKAVDALKDLGIQSYTAAGKFRPMVDIMEDFRTKLMKMPNEKRIAAILDVFKGAGGTVEARRFLQNMLLTPGNLELFRNILGGMANASGSFEKAYGIMADTTATKSQLLANKWQEVKIAAGKALIPTFMNIVNFLSKIFDWFNKLSPATQAWISKALAIGVALAGAAGIMFLFASAILAIGAAVAVVGAGFVIFMALGAAVVIALAGLAGAFIYLWNKSETFRNAIKDLGLQFKDFYDTYVYPTAKAIGDAWDKYVVPAFTALWKVIKEKILPIILDLAKFFTGRFLDNLKVIGNILKNVLVWSFQILGKIITDYVIPGLKKLNGFYHAHEGTIKKIVGWLMIFVRWLGIVVAIVVGVLASALFVAFVGGILAAGTAIAGLIWWIVKVVEWFTAVVKWCKEKIPQGFNTFVEAGKRKWHEFESDVRSIFIGIGLFFSRKWHEIVDSVIEFATNIRDSIVGAFTDAKDGASGAWNDFTAWISKKWSEFTTFVSTTFTSVRDYVINKFKDIKDGIVKVWNEIGDWLSEKWRQIGDWFYKNFIKPIEDGVGKVKAVIDKIKGFFEGLVEKMKDYGTRIIDMLVDGIEKSKYKLTGIMEKVGQAIQDHLPHSPAKKGPLSGRGNPFYAGQKIVTQLAFGIVSKSDAINAAMSAMTRNTMNMTGGLSSTPVSTYGGRTGNNSGMTQNITINTQNVTPRRHAAELGYLLAARS